MAGIPIIISRTALCRNKIGEYTLRHAVIKIRHSRCIDDVDILVGSRRWEQIETDHVPLSLRVVSNRVIIPDFNMGKTIHDDTKCNRDPYLEIVQNSVRVAAIILLSRNKYPERSFTGHQC